MRRSMFRCFAVMLAAGMMMLAGAPAIPVRAGDAVTDKVAVADIVPILVIEGDYAEIKNPLAMFGQEAKPSYGELLATIRKAKDDPRVPAMIVKIAGPALGSARTMEVHRALIEFRDSGKPLYATFDAEGMGGYVLASAANEIVIPPVSMVLLTGMRADMFFYKDTLAKLGVQAQAINTGKFKTAFEPFTHNSMSEGTRIQITEILDDVYGQLAKTVSDGRDVKERRARRWLLDGPYTAKQALDEGIVDRIAYWDDLQREVSERVGGDAKFDDEYSAIDKKKTEPPNLFALFMGGAKARKADADKGDKIAVVHAMGTIVDGRLDKSPFASGEGIASEDFIDLLDEVAAEPGLKGIVLRVDSPGGSAIASDKIWQRLEKIQASGIPYVVSMGNVAASGGYYISMGSDRIFAEPTTITGSIGVIGGRFVLGDAYEKLGIRKEFIAIGDNTGLIDESRPWTPREQAMMVALLDDTYETFTSKAADGRHMKQSEIKKLGGGRVWSGIAAKDNGLVDELGGIQEAVASAREIAKSPDAKVVDFPKEKTIMELFEEILEGTGSVNASSVKTAVRTTTDPLASLEGIVPKNHIQMMRFFLYTMSADRPQIMAVMPWSVEIK